MEGTHFQHNPNRICYRDTFLIIIYKMSRFLDKLEIIFCMACVKEFVNLRITCS